MKSCTVSKVSGGKVFHVWCINSQSKVIGENCGVIVDRNICFLCSIETRVVWNISLRREMLPSFKSDLRGFGWMASQATLPWGQRWGPWKVFAYRQAGGVLWSSGGSFVAVHLQDPQPQRHLVVAWWPCLWRDCVQVGTKTAAVSFVSSPCFHEEWAKGDASEDEKN